jgi:glycosyltransferase involved in cell wall biosynthesis
MIIYSKYNSYRKKEFQLITTIRKKNDVIFVLKIVNTEKAKPFLSSFFEKYNYLKKNNFSFDLVMPKKVGDGKIKFEYKKGKVLDGLLFESLQKLDKDRFIQLIKRYIEKIKENGIKENNNLSDEFNKIFGGKKGLKFDCIQVGCLDLNFDNIILDDNEKFWVIDYEWVFNFSLPYKYIIFRALTAFYSNYHAYNLNANFLSLPEVYNIAGITKIEKDLFIEFEYNFQKFVNESFSISLKDFRDNYYNLERNIPNINYFQQKDHEITNLKQIIQQKDSEIEQRDQIIQQKDSEIEQRDQIIQQKDSEIEQRDQIIQQKEQIIQEKEAEIAMMKSSKFWKMREIFLKIKLFKKQIYHKPSKNILFISHDASRSGAPFVLLYFLRWLKKNTNVKFSVLLQNGGELEEEFKEVAPTYVWNMSLLNSGYPRIIYYILKYTGLRKMASKNRLLRLIKKENFDLIFANSIASSESIIRIKNMADIPVINFVHELENVIVDCCGIDTLKKASKFVNYYIGSSEPVIENLKRNHDIPKDKIELVHDYIPASEFFKNKDSYNSANLREELGIPQSAFVVGASGTIEWRKGIDLYPQIASITREKSSIPIYFIWIGGNKNSTEYERVAQDLKKMKLKNRVFFVEYKIDYFSMIDAFILPSREDPYPLVCLQAAAFQKPIICFDSAGGMPEFVGKDCGFVVPYMDVEKAAEKIIYLAENRDIASEMGKNASKKVLEQHDVEKVSKKLLEIINKISL